jgi:hypothetical protein
VASELKLHEKFCEILNNRNVYLQPPASVKMKFPAIVYSRKRIDNKHANNAVYIQSFGYEATVIDYEPDSEYVLKMSQLPKCKWERQYVSDGLYHDVFTIFE